MSEKQQIVIVDDDQGMLLAIHRLLSAAGFKTATFVSPEGLCQDSAAWNAACLVMDINLPGCTGFELYRRLVNAGVEAPVIFMTAYEDADWRMQARRLGASGFLIKPFEGQRLLDAIELALKKGTQVSTPAV
jgi:FixJ family two-component response regulator